MAEQGQTPTVPQKTPEPIKAVFTGSEPAKKPLPGKNHLESKAISKKRIVVMPAVKETAKTPPTAKKPSARKGAQKSKVPPVAKVKARKPVPKVNAKAAAGRGDIYGGGVDGAGVLSAALTGLVQVANENMFAYSKRYLEDGIATTIAVLDAKTITDVVDIQTAYAKKTWACSRDYMTKLSEAAQDGLLPLNE